MENEALEDKTNPEIQQVEVKRVEKAAFYTTDGIIFQKIRFIDDHQNPLIIDYKI